MIKKNRWKHSNSCIYNINYHIIFCTKYRRPVIVDSIEARLKELVNNKCEEIGVDIKAMETMPDHVHLFVSANPTLAPHYIVQQVKGLTSRLLRQEFPSVKSRIPTLWTRSYYCESVGSLSEDAIKKYVENQKNA